jgi:DNA-directed RNA polymerase specialized sigma24 family protein
MEAPMSSMSPFPIELDAAERAELTRRAMAYTDPYYRVVRAKIVLMAADGLENKQIAARLDTSPQVVHRWRKRFFEQRLKGLDDEHRSGRPPVFSPLRGGRGQGAGL